jgi:CDP-glucose 4,6-dehydratase
MVTRGRAAADAAYWRGRRVLVTGHTGFKGAWLSLWLDRLGARVTGVALPPATEPNLFTLARVASGLESHYCDLRDAEAVARIVAAARPEVVFHLAAQPLVRAGYRDPLGTFASNVLGTAHLLDALRGVDSVTTVVAITTDKVYRSREDGVPHGEDDPLGGYDPYSASKAACELVVASYRDAFLAAQGVRVATARAGNVIGGGDWSEDRLIPDAVRAWQAGQVFEMRRPDAVRPWQHVLEPLAGYLVLAERLKTQPDLVGAYNFGPRTDEAATVREVVELARAAFGRGDVRFPAAVRGPHETAELLLDTRKVEARLEVAPRWGLAEAVRRTMEWYRRVLAGGDARSLCEAEIASYEAGT